MTRAAGVNSFFTTLSRIFGLVRDMLMANYFGTGFCCSAFVTAFTLPNLLRRLFGEGALASVFVPQFAQVMQDKGTQNETINAFAVASRVNTHANHHSYKRYYD